MAPTKRNRRSLIRFRTKMRKCRMRMMIPTNMMNSLKSAFRKAGCRRFGTSQATFGIMKNLKPF